MLWRADDTDQTGLHGFLLWVMQIKIFGGFTKYENLFLTCLNRKIRGLFPIQK